MDSTGGSSALLFDEWRYDPIAPALSRRDRAGTWRAVPVGSRALMILGLLIDRRGTVVSKDSIMRTVWPATTVEPNNLTVQIATLRRVLDDGRAGESLIQTVPGQGYRLACSVAAEPDPPLPPGTATPASRLPAIDRRTRALVAILLLLAVIGAVTALLSGRTDMAPPSPPLSIVSVSFEDAAPSPLARNLTDNVAADLARLHLFGVPHNVVIAPARARYALRGSVHRADAATSVDVQLVDTESGAELWAQRVDFAPGDTAAAQADAVRRVVFGAGPAILTAELRRRRQKRPDQPTAIDLMLQARQLLQLPPSKERVLRVRDLFERAVQLDPSSVMLKGQFAAYLMDNEDANPSGFKSVLERTRSLVTDVQTAIPNSQMALRLYAQWLTWQADRCPEAIEASQKMVDMYPNISHPNRWLGWCLTWSGRPEEALPWLERAIQLAGPSDPMQFANFGAMGNALLDLGRFGESIAWTRRALAANPDADVMRRSQSLVRIAGAQALDGDIATARQTMASAQALWPFRTVRGERPREVRDAASSGRATSWRDALRLAGMRDHADEDADFGVAPITALQQPAAGYTSRTLPGVTTLRTAEVAHLVAAEDKLVIIDTMSHNSGRSLPGAIGLRYVGAGGSLSDLAQDRLWETMRELTKGDPARPILAVGWNSESLDGTNLALRLVALGYSNVSWYRGGREAWEVSDAPETALTIRDW